MREKGKGLSIDSCLTTGWIPTLAKLARVNRAVRRGHGGTGVMTKGTPADMMPL